MTNKGRILRKIADVIPALETKEGVGANVKRSIGINRNRDIDPMIMLDEFFVKKPAGFPDHPHRGFQTVTYMLEGAFKHKDNKGHEGTIEPFGVQWMTAGSGIVHSEMPATDGVNRGLQLWMNLANKDRMIPPKYDEVTAEEIPHKTENGVTVRVVAGESMGLKGAVETVTPSTYLHFTMDEGSSHTQTINPEWNGFIYIMTGSLAVGETLGKESNLLKLATDGGDHISFTVPKGTPKADFILVTGKPLKEKYVQYGPIVMGTQEEIQQAFADFYAGKF